MPYRRTGRKVYYKATGKWKLKQTCGSIAKAIRALKLLRGLESGSIKKSEVGRRNRKKRSKK